MKDPISPLKAIPYLLVFSVFASLLTSTIYAPSMSSMAQEFKVDDNEIQLTLSIYLLALAVSRIFYGPVIEVFGCRLAMLIGMVSFFIASVGCMFAATNDHLLIWRFLQGLGGGGFAVVRLVALQNLYSPIQAAKLLSQMGMVTVLAPMLSPVLGGYIEVWYGWQLDFIIISFVSGILALFTWRYFKHPELLPLAQCTLPGMTKNYMEVLASKRYWVYGALFTILVSGIWCYITVVSVYFVKTLKLSPDVCGLYVGLTSVAYFVGSAFSQATLERLGLERILGRGLFLSAVGGICLFLVSLFFSTSPIVLTAAMSIYVFGMAYVYSPSTGIALSCFTSGRGISSSLLSTSRMSSAALGGYLGSIFDDTTMFSTSLLVLGCGIVSLFTFLLRTRQSLAFFLRSL